MNQAIKLSTIDNGDTATWQTLGTSHDEVPHTYDELLAWFNKYLANYLKYSKLEKVNLGGKDKLAVHFLDGTVLTFPTHIYDIGYYLDPKDMYNNSTQNGVNKFAFRFTPYQVGDPEKEPALKYTVSPGFEPHTYGWDGTFDGAKHGGSYACYEQNAATAGQLCTKLIQLNGWKIPEDYIWKF